MKNGYWILLILLIIGLLPGDTSAEAMTATGKFTLAPMEGYPPGSVWEYGVPITKNSITFTFDPEVSGPVTGEGRFEVNGKPKWMASDDNCQRKFHYEMNNVFYNASSGSISGNGTGHDSGSGCWSLMGETFDNTYPQFWAATYDKKTGKITGVIDFWSYKLNASKAEEKKEESFLTGKITLDSRHPAKNVKVTFKFKGTDLSTYTDDEGKYIIRFTGDAKEGETGRLYVKLQYKKDNKIYFRILVDDKPVWIMKKFTINSESDLNQDINLKSGLDESKGHYGHPNPEDIRKYALMYRHMTEALEFFKDYLGAEVGYKLPVDVNANYSGRSTFYRTRTSTIFISHAKNDPYHPYRPINREWHEFAHHVMFSEYLAWPKDIHNAYPHVPMKNHAGYINPATSDSFLEGFAGFMAMVMADHYKISNPEIYSSLGNWEFNYKAWTEAGRDEDRAVAGIFWDLYDEKDDDNVELPLKEIWKVLMSNRHDNMYEVYTAFIEAYPSQKKEIDEIFILHGFFADKNKGNGQWDVQEPYIDEVIDGEIDYWVDYATHRYLAYPYLEYDPGEAVGIAANYNRTERRSFEPHPGHFIKTNNNVPYYLVKVTFPDNSFQDYEMRTFNERGYIFVDMPPRESGALLQVTAEDEVTGNPLVFHTEEFHGDYADSVERGYYVEHDFQVQGALNIEPSQVSSLPVDGPWEEYDVEASPDDFIYVPPQEEPYPLEDEMGAPAAGSGLVFESRAKHQGSTIQIPITLAGEREKVGNMDITLGYDPSVIQAAQVIKGSLTTGSIFDYNIPGQGEIRISLAHREGFMGTGTIAYVVFEVIGEPGSSSPLIIESLSANNALDYGLMDIPNKNGIFHVTEITDSVGDCNGDGKISSVDALCALKMAVDRIPQDPVMDINNDNDVTSLDARAILKISVEPVPNPRRDIN